LFDGNSFHFLDTNSADGWIFSSPRLNFENNIVKIPTGLILEAPSGWDLFAVDANPRRGAVFVHSLIENRKPPSRELWLDLACFENDRVISIRKGEPLVHLIPVRAAESEWNIELNKIGQDNFCDNDRAKFETGKQNAKVPECPFFRGERTLEEERAEFRDPKFTEAQFFAVFERDISRNLRIIGAKK
jgi:hypothetical protein